MSETVDTPVEPAAPVVEAVAATPLEAPVSALDALAARVLALEWQAGLVARPEADA